MPQLSDDHLPERQLLSNQVVSFLRQGIDEGRWKGTLPSEAELCRELKVSRVTLRKALAQLQGERWIEAGGKGRHHRIRRRPSSSAVKALGKIVRMVTPFHPFEIGAVNQLIRRALAERIGSAGYRIEMEFKPQLYERFKKADFERLVAKPDTAGWVLTYPTEPMQRWFESIQRPCVNLGFLHSEDIRLSSVYIDTEASGRHAAGLFHARGHRKMAYLIDRFTSRGDRLFGEAFVRASDELGAQGRLITHERSMESVCKGLASALAERPSTTAFLSSCPEHCVTILCRLQSSGVRVPADVSLIAGWDDPILDFTFPTMSRYRIDGEAMGRKVGDQLLDQLRHGTGKIRAAPFLPEFVKGGTLGRHGD